MNPPSPVGEGWPPLASFALGEGRGHLPGRKI
jgi:hypothetical protein